MRFELPLPCKNEGCGVRNPVSVLIMASWWEWKCGSCGYDNAILPAVEWTLGWRVLEKAKTEYLADADYSGCIVFSAMAIDCELARLFVKWRVIDTRATQQQVPSLDDFEEEYRHLGNVAVRIQSVGRLLDRRGIDVFARASGLAERIESDAFPSLHLGSLPSDIQREVFWPRNRILHAGFFDYGQEDAKRVHNIASLGLDLLKRMDVARRVGSS